MLDNTPEGSMLGSRCKTKTSKGPNGKCPQCGSNDLEYGKLESLDYKLVAYPFTCNSCGAQGRETWGLIDGETEIEKEI